MPKGSRGAFKRLQLILGAVLDLKPNSINTKLCFFLSSVLMEIKVDFWALAEKNSS